MQINKKLTTISITALLLLSMLAFVVPAFAISATPTASATSGAVGTKVTLSGTDASAGGLVQVYWDNLGGALLNSTYASGTSYSIVAFIPDSTAGAHNLIVRDVSTGTTVASPFTITPAISLSATRGIPGDSVNVTGTGFGSQKNLNVTFNGVDVTPAALQVTSITGNITVTFIVPTIAYGNYAVVATDNATNTATATGGFTVGASVTISPTSGPSGTVVTATGRGFTRTAGLNIVLTIGGFPVANLTTIKTLADGTFTGQFIVPSGLTIGTRYTVSATDSVPITGSTSGATGGFRVTGNSAITASPTSAAPGGSVTLTGSNFTAIAGTSVTVRFGATSAGTFVVATFATNSTGGFSGVVTVPNLPTGSYILNATDAYALNATTPFTLAITALFLSPTSGITGSVVSLTGFGFGLTGATTFNVTMGGRLMTTAPDNSVASLVAGSAAFVVPTMPTGIYTIVVTDANGLTASATYTVTATSKIVITPSTAPLGVQVTITSTGFNESAAFTPILFSLINGTSTFNLDLSPYITDPPGFALGVNASGYCLTYFTLPTSIGLAQGVYTINATDLQGLTANATFTIGAATVNVGPRSTTYHQGDTISFNIQSTFAVDFNINVYDPTGTTNVLTILAANFVPVGVLQVYPYSTSSQMLIPSDAPLGKWTWNATFPGTPLSGNFTVISSSSSTIDALNQTLVGIGANVTSIKGTVATIQTSTGTIQTTLAALNASIIAINGNVATLSTSIGTITTSINSVQSTVSGLSGTITSISSGIASVQTTLGTITTSLGNLDAVLGAVAGQNAEITTSLGTITTSLTSIGTTVTKIDGNVATIKTDLGTLTGTVTSISNGVATIQTNLGTMQTSIGNLQTDVTSTKDTTSGLSPLVIVAIVLALVAAIAAIASIVLMRRKIAG